MAANDRISLRYSHQHAKTADPGTFGVWGGVKDYAGTGTTPTYNMALNYNRVWSASLVQEVRMGRTSHHNMAITDAHGMNLADQIGVPGVNLNNFTSGPPTININGYLAGQIYPISQSQLSEGPNSFAPAGSLARNPKCSAGLDRTRCGSTHRRSRRRQR